MFLLVSNFPNLAILVQKKMERIVQIQGKILFTWKKLKSQI
jgi:hypothetical protein